MSAAASHLSLCDRLHDPTTRLGLTSIVASCALMAAFVVLFAIVLLAFVVGVTGWRP